MWKLLIGIVIGVVIGCVLGSLVGYGVAKLKFEEEAQISEMRWKLKSGIEQQKYGALFSLSPLLKLEQGKIEEAKAILAKQAASYASENTDYDARSKGWGPIIPLITATSEKSDALREALAKPTATPKQ
jgi:hypothetical protein